MAASENNTKIVTIDEARQQLDQRLRELDTVGDVNILNPREFLDFLNDSE